MNGPGGEALREVRVDAAPEGCPVCAFSSGEDRRAVLRPADPQDVEEGVPFTINLLGDRQATRGTLEEMREHPRFADLEVVNLTPYCMVLKARELSTAKGGPPSLLASVQGHFGDDVIVDPFLVDDGRARIRALLTEPATTREALQGVQAMQEDGAWEVFQVQGVREFDPREHVGLLRRVLVPGQESLLRLAADMGYYDSPKKCTLEDIGEKVGLSASPVHKRLKESEERLVNAFLEPDRVAHPETDGEAPQWIQDIARSDGPMVEILARYRWSGTRIHDYMESHPDARVVLHPFYDDPQQEGVAFLAVVVGGDPGALVEGAREAPHLRDVEVASRGEDHVVVRLEAVASPDLGGALPSLQLARRLGREAYLNPVFAGGGDVWLSVVTARHLTFEDVERELDGVGEDVGWDEWDLVSIRPVEGHPPGGGAGRGLTDRQREVLDIAQALGYYETPRRSTLQDIAETLGVSENAVHKNLTAAERKIILTYLQGGL